MAQPGDLDRRIIGAGPIANTLISDSFEDKHRGRAVGYFYGGQQPGGIVHRTGDRAVLRLLRLVLLPFGIGYFIGTVTGGWLVSSLDRVLPRRGRVAFLRATRCCLP